MKGFCLALIIAVLLLSASVFQNYVPLLLSWFDTAGWIAPILFLGLYGIATVCFMPTMILTLAGGALFGPILGSMFNLAGATLGAVCAFSISRYWMFERIVHKKNDRINQLITGVERWGWQFIALTRLVPVIPFNLVNYGLGLTRIKFHHYVITTIIFLIPVEIISTYCGYVGMDFLIHSKELYKGSMLFFLVIGSIILIWNKFFRKKQT